MAIINTEGATGRVTSFTGYLPSTPNINKADLHVDFASYDTHTATQYIWFTSSGARIVATGTNIQVDEGNQPIAGKITSITVDIGTNGSGNNGSIDIDISGLGGGVDNPDGIDLTSLIFTGSTEFQAEQFWSAVLTSEDTPSSGFADTFVLGDEKNTLAGDGIEWDGVVDGPDADSFTAAVFDGFLVGDYWVQVSEEFTGSDDHFDIEAIASGFVDPWLIGDVRTLNTSEGEMHGGDDTFEFSGHTISIAGDVYEISHGILHGGDDIIDLNESMSSGSNSIIAAGDLWFGPSTALDQSGTLFGGDDTLIGGGGIDKLYGEVTNVGDLILSGGNDFISGGGGNDKLFGQTGDDTLEGGLGDDVLSGGDGTDTALFNTSENITLDLGKSSNQDTGLGSDKFSSIENATTGKGNDALTGSSDDNVLDGDKGNDTLEGKGGDDRIFGGDGNDTGDGGGGDDNIKGGSGKDKLYGGSENDKLFGGSGKDRLEGGSGNDKLYGESKSDKLYGDGGDDKLFGGGGSDKMYGGGGDDVLKGGKGNDVFIFAGSFGKDEIQDFARNADRIDLSAVSKIKDFNDLKNNHAEQMGADLVISSGASNEITLLDVKLNKLDSDDFLF